MADAISAPLEARSSGGGSTAGSDNAQDAAQLAAWRKAAEHDNDGDATARVGMAYGNGTHGLTRDLNEAFEWFERAAELGDLDGVICSCKLMLGGSMPPSGNATRVFQRVQAALRGGAKCVIPLLAACLREGHGCDKNEERAVLVSRLGANMGQTESMADLALALVYGNGCDVDQEEAFRWFEKAAEKGNATALRHCAVLLLGGIGCAKDTERAKLLLQRAADAGDEQAQKLVHLWVEQKGTLVFRAGDEGEKGCMLSHDGSSGLDTVRKSAEAGSPSSMSQLAGVLMHGHDCEADQPQAVKWYRRAALAGDTDAMACLGVALVHGHGCDADHAEAFQWFKRAAAKGDVRGLRNCGLMLRRGIGCTGDEAAGREMLQQAADKGDKKAAKHLEP